MKSSTYRKFLGLVCVGSFALGATACGPNEPAPEENKSTTQKELDFEVTYERAESFNSEDIDYNLAFDLTEANSAFAFDLYRKFRDDEGSKNLVFSPFSVSRALFNYYKPDAPTEPAFREVLRYTPEVATRDAWDMVGWFAMYRDPADYSDLEESRYSVFESSDIYWVQRGSGGNGVNFLDRTHELDFKSNPEQAQDIINTWIEDRSYGLLPDFLDPNIITRDTEAVTTNVVFFRGMWQEGFDRVGDKPFYADSGEETAPMMLTKSETQAFKGADVHIVRLRYTMDYSIEILMPLEDHATWASQLDLETYEQLTANMSQYAVTVTLPEFQSESTPSLGAAISELREETGTDSGGTLTGAYMEAFVHKAVIKVDKEGTTAAAGTAVIEYLNSAPEPSEELELTIDRPFTYVIKDDLGSILFLGEYTGK